MSNGRVRGVAAGGPAWANVVVGVSVNVAGGAAVAAELSDCATVTVGPGGGVVVFGGGGVVSPGGGAVVFGGGAVAVPVSPACFCSAAIFCSTSARLCALGEFRR